MKYQFPFTLVSGLIKRWTTTKTTDSNIKAQIMMPQDISHAITPAQKNPGIAVKPNDYMAASSTGDYCSTY